MSQWNPDHPATCSCASCEYLASVARWKERGVDLRAPVPAAPAPFCHSGRDGDCDWSECPQNRDAEPDTTGRSCPLFPWDDDDAARSVEYRAAAAPAPEAVIANSQNVTRSDSVGPERSITAPAPMPDYDLTYLRHALEQWDREFGQSCGSDQVRGQVLIAPVIIQMLRSRLAVALTEEQIRAASERMVSLQSENDALRERQIALEHERAAQAREAEDVRDFREAAERDANTFIRGMAAHYQQTIAELHATVAAQAREIETLRADKARLERELADLRQMHALRGRMNDEMREIIGRIFGVLQPHIETLCAARAPEPQP